jgi:hypothetical protein
MSGSWSPVSSRIRLPNRIHSRGSAIVSTLAAAGIPDPVAAASDADPMVQAGLAYNPVSKRERIRQAVAGNQQRTGNGNALVAFIREAMNPQRYMRRPELFEERTAAARRGSCVRRAACIISDTVSEEPAVAGRGTLERGLKAERRFGTRRRRAGDDDTRHRIRCRSAVLAYR